MSVVNMDSSSLSSEMPGSYNGTDAEDEWLLPFMGSMFFIVSIVGLLGNGTVMYVILRFAKMKTVTNVYILNLALADNLFLVALIFLAITSFQPSWIFGKVMCHLVFTIDGLNQFTSIFCLTFMAIDRYVAVCYAVKASCYRNMRVATIINVAVWILAIAAASPIMAFTRFDPALLRCGLDFTAVVGDAAFAVSRAFSFYVFVMGFVIPMGVIVACYSMIMVRLHKMGTKTGKWEKSRKVNRLVLCVIIVFVVCWSPFFLFRVAAAFNFEYMRRYFFLSELTICLGYMNSCANPFLYGFLSDSFKKSFRKVWHCGNNSGYELTSTDARPWRLRNPCLGDRPERSTKTRLGRGGDDDTMSGGRSNAYPLTAVTSAASEITVHHKNGAMGAPSYA